MEVFFELLWMAFRLVTKFLLVNAAKQMKVVFLIIASIRNARYTTVQAMIVTVNGMEYATERLYYDPFHSNGWSKTGRFSWQISKIEIYQTVLMVSIAKLVFIVINQLCSLSCESSIYVNFVINQPEDVRGWLAHTQMFLKKPPSVIIRSWLNMLLGIQNNKN